MSIDSAQSTAEDVAGFLAWCGGAKIELVREYPEEHTRLATIGATVLFTGLFASASSAYAIYTVFGAGWSVPVLAVLWGAVIFNIDRLIVMTMQGSSLRKLIAAIPRLGLATVIAVVITRPLELWIFAPEINRGIKISEAKTRDDNMKAWNAEVDAAQQRYQAVINATGATAGVGTSQAALGVAVEGLAECNTERERVAAEHRAELYGTGGSRRYGNGPVAKELLKRIQAIERRCDAIAADVAAARQAHDAALIRQTEVAKDHKNTLDKTIAEATERRDRKSAGLDSTRIDSLLGRNQQLANLAAADSSVRWMDRFLMALFWLIEALPVLAKLMAGDSIYDAVVNERREAVRATKRGAAEAVAAHVETGRVEAKAAASARRELVELHYKGVADIIDAGRAAWHPPQAVVDELLAAIQRTARQVFAGAQPQPPDIDGAFWSLARLRPRTGLLPILEGAGYLFASLTMVVLIFFAFKLINPFDRATLNYALTAITAVGSLMALPPLKRMFSRLSNPFTREEK